MKMRWGGRRRHSQHKGTEHLSPIRTIPSASSQRYRGPQLKWTTSDQQMDAMNVYIVALLIPLCTPHHSPQSLPVFS